MVCAVNTSKMVLSATFLRKVFLVGILHHFVFIEIIAGSFFGPINIDEDLVQSMVTVNSALTEDLVSVKPLDKHTCRVSWVCTRHGPKKVQIFYM